MDILTRKQAREKGSKTYFTGAPCKNGHVAYRYTQSGSCSTCIREANGLVDHTASQRREVKTHLIRAKARLFHDDAATFFDAVWGYALMRWPFMTQGDVRPNQAPMDNYGGQGVYKFDCHPDDLPPLRALAVSLFSARCGSGVEARQRAHASLGLK